MPIFSGKFLYTVDSKGRINIPAIFRSQLSRLSDNTFHITYGPNDCLVVFPREVFIPFAEKLDGEYGSLSASDDERGYFLEVMADAHPVRCDQQGRIVVSQEHLDHAKIKEKVLIVGAVKKMEFWNPKIFNEFLKKSKLSKKSQVKKYGGADREMKRKTS
jgi:MraZ protein